MEHSESINDRDYYGNCVSDKCFRFNIENYPVYLIIGSTLFSFYVRCNQSGHVVNYREIVHC